MKINDEGTSNAAYWHERAMKAEARLAEQDVQLKSYDVLRRAVNESTNECGPDCDDHGHADDCPALSPSSWLEDQQRKIDALEARLAEEESAHRVTAGIFASTLVRADAAEARIKPLEETVAAQYAHNVLLEVRLQKVMARCADLLDEDQFNELDAMTRATVQVTPDGGNRQLADCERQRDRGMFCLMEMMQAYERRIRSACTTPEQLAAKPWECAEYIKAARYMVACKAEIDAGRLVTMSEQNATPVNQWQPIETAPKQRKIIVHYLNPLGKHRTVMACYYGEKSLEMHDDYDDVGTFDEESGTLFADAGWYEEHDSDDPILPLGGVPTHWMPLPPPPVITLTVTGEQK
jgi:hypothetical protein